MRHITLGFLALIVVVPNIAVGSSPLTCAVDAVHREVDNRDWAPFRETPEALYAEYQRRLRESNQSYFAEMERISLALARESDSAAADRLRLQLSTLEFQRQSSSLHLAQQLEDQRVIQQVDREARALVSESQTAAAVVTTRSGQEVEVILRRNDDGTVAIINISGAAGSSSASSPRNRVIATRPIPMSDIRSIRPGSLPRPPEAPPRPAQRPQRTERRPLPDVPDFDDAISLEDFQALPRGTRGTAILVDGTEIPVEIQGRNIVYADQSIRDPIQRGSRRFFGPDQARVASVRVGENRSLVPDMPAARLRGILGEQPSRLVRVTLDDGTTQVMEARALSEGPILIPHRRRPAIEGEPVVVENAPSAIPLSRVRSVATSDLNINGQPVREDRVQLTRGFFVRSGDDLFEVSVDNFGFDNQGNLTSVIVSSSSPSRRRPIRLTPEDLERFKQFVLSEGTAERAALARPAEPRVGSPEPTPTAAAPPRTREPAPAPSVAVPPLRIIRAESITPERFVQLEPGTRGIAVLSNGERVPVQVGPNGSIIDRNRSVNLEADPRHERLLPSVDPRQIREILPEDAR